MSYFLMLSPVFGEYAELKFPIPVQEMPELNREIETDSFMAYNGKEYTFPKGFKAVEFEISTWFPKSEYFYSFQVGQTQELRIFDWLEYWFTNFMPVTVLVSDNKNNQKINMQALITGMYKGVNNIGETTLTLKFKQWEDYYAI